MRSRAALLSLILGLALASTAQAGTYTYGSNLTLPANIDDSHPRDWSAWPTQTTPASVGGYSVTTAGEVSKVALRGSIPAPAGLPPFFVFRVVVLRPQADGTVKLMVASTDFAQRFAGKDPATITTLDLQAETARMCVLPGDVVALATSGGYDATSYSDGVPVQMFSRVVTSSYAVTKSADTFQVGESEPATPHPAAELLMQVTVGTDADARPFCRVGTPSATPTPGPSATPAPTSTPAVVSIPAPKRAVKVRRGKVKLSLACAGPGACMGTLALSRLSKNYGKASFSIPAGTTGAVTVKLTKAARKGKGRVTVKAVAAIAGAKKVSQRFKISR